MKKIFFLKYFKIKLNLIILFILVFLSASIIAQVTQFPQIYFNGQGTGGFSLSVRPIPSLNSTPLTSLTWSSKIGAESFTTSVESNGIATWAKVCLPSTNGIIKYGYMLYGQFSIRINETNNYATVTASPYLFIRPCAGCTSSNVSLNGQNASYGQNSIVALTGATQNINGINWYEVYLTTDCSSPTGWLSSGTNSSFLSINIVTNNYFNVAGSVKNNNDVLIWGANINIGSWTTNSTEGFYQYKVPQNWTGLINCSHQSYNTSTPTNYNHIAISHNYSRNFVLSSGCNFFISPSSVAPSSSAGSGSVSVTVAPGCNWTAISNNLSWLTVTSGSSGAGNGSVGYSYTINPNSTIRVGTITIAGHTFTVTQAGSGCSSSVIAGSNTPISTGGNINLTASTITGATYNWTGPGGYTASVQNPTRTNATTVMSGIYTVTANVSGCPAVSNSTNVSVTSCVSSTAPTGATANPSSIVSGSSSTLSVSGGTLGTGASWKWYSGGCGTTLQGTGSTISVSPTSTTTYYVRAEGTCHTTACASTTVNISIPTINNLTIDYSLNSVVIPPWQRQNDNFDGKVTVIRTGNVNAPWHLEVDVHNNNGIIVEKTIKYPSISTSTQFFNTANDPELREFSKEGKILAYYAVLDNSVPLIRRKMSGNNVNSNNGLTYIIEKKWNKKNVVFFNEPNGTNKIRIPIKYDRSDPSIYISISRAGSVAAMLPLVASDPEGLKNSNGSTSFNIGNDGYCTISLTNSNLSHVMPGDFKIDVWASGLFSSETMYFDLTKFGKVFPDNSSQNKIIIAIGGIYHEIENNVKTLWSSPSNPDNSFSILPVFENNGFSTWYIAQGNANSIIRNGYDIGIAIDSIRNRNQSITEFNFVTHSKGGLDMRAFLSGLTRSYDNNSQISYQSSSINGKIKKVLFLGTPHNGANLATAGLPISKFINQPGAIELSNWKLGGVIDMLNGMPLPTSINYANLASYKSHLGKISDYGLTGLPAYINSSNDGIVPLSSNNYLSNHFPLNSVKQLYQNGNWGSILSCGHFQVHKVNFLSQADGDHNSANCLSLTYPTNLSKILAFFKNNPNPIYNSTTPFPSCVVTPPTTILINLSGSIISGAKIYSKPKGNATYYFLGGTNEQGAFAGSLLPPFNMGDSLMLVAEGYETLILVVDSAILSIGKIDISMLKTLNPTSKIKYPLLKLVNQDPIISNSNLSLETSGLNVLNYQINSPLNQDTIFAPLNLINSQFVISLDTGYNQIIVRLIGQEDTVVLRKEVFFLPDTLLNQNTYNVSITANVASLGTKVYVNNQFVKEIKSSTDVIPVLNGRNTFKFSKFGFIDSLVNVDSATMISVALQLFPHSYTSPIDSNIVDFPLQGRLQYRMNVTMLDSARLSIISLKQMDGAFLSKSLIPKSRKFEFRHLNSPTWSNLKTSIVLDQSENLCRDSIYLLKILDDAIFSKIAFDNTTIGADYDSIVQKLTYSYINFNQGTAKKEALVIMQKQAPIVNILPEINLNKNDTLFIPLTQFFRDPDSLKNDMSYEVGNHSAHLNIQIINNSVRIITQNILNGNHAFTIRARHDCIWRNNLVNVKGGCITPGLPANIAVSVSDENITTLTWDPGNPVGSSNVEYQWVIGTHPNVNYGSGISQGITSNLSVSTNLVPAGGTYYARVIALTDCDNTSSDYATSDAFNTVPCIIPGIPINIKATATSNTSALLSWQAGIPKGAPTVHYYWVVGTNPQVTYGNGISQGITETENAIVSNLNEGTTYYLRVFASSTCNSNTFGYGTSAAFTTNGIVPCTTPGTPINVLAQATGQHTANLTWSHGSPLGSDEVNYFWVIGMNPNVSYGDGAAQGFTNLTSITTTSLLCNTTYYLRVYAMTSCDNNISDYGTSIAFTTSACSCTTPGLPRNLNITQVAHNSANFSWDPSIPAGSPNVTYLWVIGKSPNVTYGNGIDQGNTNLNSASTSLLTCNTTYYLRVFAQTSCDYSISNYTTSIPFTTSACLCVTPGVPINVNAIPTSSTSAHLTWSSGNPLGSPSITYFWVIGTNPNVTHGNGVAQGTTHLLTAPVVGLTAGPTYYLRVFARTSCNLTTSNYATSASFNLLNPCPTPTIQATTITFSFVSTQEFTANWINGNGSRRVVVINTTNSFTPLANGTDPTANTKYSGYGEQVVYNGNGNSVTIKGLKPNQTYWVRIYEANCDESNSVYNTTFTVQNPISQSTRTVIPSVQSFTASNVILFDNNIIDISPIYSTNKPYDTHPAIDIYVMENNKTRFTLNASNSAGFSFQLVDQLTIVADGNMAINPALYGRLQPVVQTSHNSMYMDYIHPENVNILPFLRLRLRLLFEGGLLSMNVPLNIHPAQIPLPVDLIDFRAKYIVQDDNNELSWTSKSEINNDYFDVERSFERSPFENIGKVFGAGNSTSAIDYLFKDTNIPSDGNYVYRLKQVDFDGQESFSKLASVLVSRAQSVKTGFFPNPASDLINCFIDAYSGAQVSIEVFNILGQLVTSQSDFEILSDTRMTKQLDCKNFGKGIFNVVFTVDGIRYNHKLFIIE